MKEKTIKYVEPAGYFPRNIRKKCKIGEYANTKQKSETKRKKGKKLIGLAVLLGILYIPIGIILELTKKYK